MREELPPRRPNETVTFDHRWPNGKVSRFHATLGYYPDGRVGEVFLACTRTGTDMEVVTKDSAMIISLALQHGALLETLAPSFLRDGRGVPEGPLGTLVDILTGRRKELRL